MPFPVTFDVERPPVFQRAHVFLRAALLIVIGWIGHPIGFLWLGVPAVAAILVSQKGGRRYPDEDGPTVTRVLGWLLAVVAYLALLTDRLPGQDEHRIDSRWAGRATPRSPSRRAPRPLPRGRASHDGRGKTHSRSLSLPSNVKMRARGDGLDERGHAGR
jgi:hypothetical protein